MVRAATLFREVDDTLHPDYALKAPSCCRLPVKVLIVDAELEEEVSAHNGQNPDLLIGRRISVSHRGSNTDHTQRRSA